MHEPSYSVPMSILLFQVTSDGDVIFAFQPDFQDLVKDDTQLKQFGFLGRNTVMRVGAVAMAMVGD